MGTRNLGMKKIRTSSVVMGLMILFSGRAGLRPRQTNGSLVMGLMIIFSTVLIHPAISLAHKVYIFAWFDGIKIHTESYFGSKKVKSGLIRVFAPSGEQLLEGHTNEKGEFSFKPPEKSDLRIVIEAGMGHRNEYMFKAEDFGDAPVKSPEPSKAEDPKKASASPIETDAEQIRMIVEEAVDSRMKQVLQELAGMRKEKGPGFTEIVGGIGYILGLMGIVMYFKARENHKISNVTSQKRGSEGQE